MKLPHRSWNSILNRLSHHTPQAILLGLEGSDPETIDTGTIPSRYTSILTSKSLLLGGKHRIFYDLDRDMLWRWDQVLRTHPNGMRFACFGEEGELLAVNEYFRLVFKNYFGVCILTVRTVASVAALLSMTKPKVCHAKGASRLYLQSDVCSSHSTVDENLFYKGVDKSAVHGARLQQTHSLSEPLLDQPPSNSGSGTQTQGQDQTASQNPVDPGHPPYPFESGNSLLALTRKHNVRILCVVSGAVAVMSFAQMTIAQIVHDNEMYFGLSEADIHIKVPTLNPHCVYIFITICRISV